MKTLFKAYHRERKQMYWFDLMWGNHLSGNGYIGMVEWGKTRETDNKHNGNQELIDPNSCDILRFTGIKDKGGKDICEGDILNIKWSTANYGKYFQSDDMYNDHEVTVYVKFETLSFRFFLPTEKQFGLRKDATIEIIGNIYENPNLLQ